MKIAKTLNEFIDEVNNCHYGFYEVGTGIDDTTEPLTVTVYFDSAKWAYYPKANAKRLVLYSTVDGIMNDRISISDVKSIEHVRGNEFGNAYKIVAGNDNQREYVFMLKRTKKQP